MAGLQSEMYGMKGLLCFCKSLLLVDYPWCRIHGPFFILSVYWYAQWAAFDKRRMPSMTKISNISQDSYAEANAGLSLQASDS